MCSHLILYHISSKFKSKIVNKALLFHISTNFFNTKNLTDFPNDQKVMLENHLQKVGKKTSIVIPLVLSIKFFVCILLY